jgi:hypothetical protein
MILKSLYKSVSSTPLLCLRQTNALPDRPTDCRNKLFRVIVQTWTLTAEHYKFCWSVDSRTVFKRTHTADGLLIWSTVTD